jgi:hypothetical protein
MDELKVGDEAPEIAGNSINMGFFKLSALKGKERSSSSFRGTSAAPSAS